jgi:hypothetical protein
MVESLQADAVGSATRDDRPQLERRGHHESVVVVGVLPDEVRAGGRLRHDLGVRGKQRGEVIRNALSAAIGPHARSP